MIAAGASRLEIGERARDVVAPGTLRQPARRDADGNRTGRAGPDDESRGRRLPHDGDRDRSGGRPGRPGGGRAGVAPPRSPGRSRTAQRLRLRGPRVGCRDAGAASFRDGVVLAGVSHRFRSGDRPDFDRLGHERTAHAIAARSPIGPDPHDPVAGDRRRGARSQANEGRPARRRLLCECPLARRRRRRDRRVRHLPGPPRSKPGDGRVFVARLAVAVGGVVDSPALRHVVRKCDCCWPRLGTDWR